MATEERIRPDKLGAHLKKYLKCKELPEHSKRQTVEYLTKQLFIMRPEEEYRKDYNQLMGYLASLGPRQVCQYQVRATKTYSRFLQNTSYIINFCCPPVQEQRHRMDLQGLSTGMQVTILVCVSPYSHQGCCTCGDARTKLA
jgi:hypothetical protein